MSGINNTVTISENANPETTALYGGLSSSGNKLTDPLNVNNTTGNGFTAKNVANIETVNETISKVPANETVLELTLTISNASIRFCIHAIRGGHHTGSIPDQGRIGQLSDFLLPQA